MPQPKKTLPTPKRNLKPDASGFGACPWDVVVEQIGLKWLNVAV